MENAVLVKPDDIDYKITEYNNFNVREVKGKGEFHICIKDSSSLYNVVQYFQNELKECDVGLIDPEGVLNLEYPIYILITDTMMLNSINEIFSIIDENLN